MIGPTVIGPPDSGNVSARPSASSKRPGLNRKKFAPYTNIARKLIQAACHGENHPARLWWLSRPSRSFKKRMGTSSVRRRMCTDFSTISDAYSQDCERRSIRIKASVVMPRIPQWMSEKRQPKMTLRMAVVTGVPR